MPLARTVDRRGAYRLLVGKNKGNTLLRMPWHRREENIKMDLQEIGQGGMDYSDLTHDRDR